MTADISNVKIVIKGTRSIDEYKGIRQVMEEYAQEHEVSEIRWDNGIMLADGVPV